AGSRPIRKMRAGSGLGPDQPFCNDGGIAVPIVGTDESHGIESGGFEAACSERIEDDNRLSLCLAALLGGLCKLVLDVERNHGTVMVEDGGHDGAHALAAPGGRNHGMMPAEPAARVVLS